MNGWPIDHIALVVADLDEAIALYTQRLGFSTLYRETIEDQGVEAIGLRAGDSVVELLRPLDPSSAIARYRGDARSKLHHVAFRVAGIESALADLKSSGIRLIDERPRDGAHGSRVAFLHPKSTGGV
ncbi:MAG: methylmalonyl-CoA epimerase, partial [Candidatus Tyrphobacter sp.]